MLKIYIYFFISILIHEISHIFIAKIFKIKLKNLRVSIFGASLEIEKTINNKQIKKILMYLAGPISNLLVVILMQYININEQEKNIIIYTNLSLFIFNLLPIIPLDGGNILKEIFQIKLDNLTANKVSLYISKINLMILTFVYSIAILKIKNVSILMLIIYLWYLNFVEEKKLEILEKTYKIINKDCVKIEEKTLN